MMRKTILFIAFALSTSTSCRQGNSDCPPDVTTPLLHIKIARVLRTDMADTVRIYGEVRLRRETELASQFDGRLADCSLLLGDRVTRGEQVGTIIPATREALLQVMDRINIANRPPLEQQIKAIPLSSPMDGIVLDVVHHSGDVVQKGEPILHIGDLSKLDVHGDLPVRYLPLIHGEKSLGVEFVDYPHQPMTLPIEAVSGEVDELKQTVAVRLGLDNPTGEFRTGMRVRMYFPGKTHEATLVIPREALLEEEGVFSTFVVKSNRVEKRLLEVGILQGDRSEILSGLKENEEVVTQKAYSLVDGAEVIID